ncbi:MAG: hypothetical protein ABJG86_11130 [Nitratireductor sp.]
MEFRAADLLHYAALFPAAVAGERQWKAARVQILSGPAWTLFEAGRPVLLCGLYPLHSGILEAWLMMPPHRRPGAAALRFLLESAATGLPERIVIARIDDANPAGRRLARLAGFVPVDEFLPGTAIRTWVRPAAGNVTRHAHA